MTTTQSYGSWGKQFDGVCAGIRTKAKPEDTEEEGFKAEIETENRSAKQAKAEPQRTQSFGMSSKDLWHKFN
eukprot:4338806-Amphidinium_carterae.2